MSRLILGLNTDHGDASAALVGEDGIIAAIAEERINRIKHCADFPALAIKEVLRIAGATVDDVTDIAIARNPFANIAWKVAYVAMHRRSGLSLAKKRLQIHRNAKNIAERLAHEVGVSSSMVKAKVHHIEHHLAHVASAFYWSPFDRCCAFTNDGAGDFATTMWAMCHGNEIDIISRSHWPHSLGVFYTALCQFIGFNKYGEEYKVMGLSAYGKNSYSSLMREIVQFHPHLGLRLNLSYFQHQDLKAAFENITEGQITLPQLWGSRFTSVLGPSRQRENEICQRERDLASSMQNRYEEVFLDMVSALVRRTETRDIVMAGGCALNSVANGRMITEGYVNRAYFQPAASDDGTALGAALYVLHGKYGFSRKREVKNAFWGPQWSESDIEVALKGNGRPYARLDREHLLQTAATALAQEKIIGWFQGREEWGPRALGNRSILCNPSPPNMKDILNSRIKNREPFRPFAPVLRIEDLSECFEGSHPVPFMIVVYKVRPQWRDRLSAITHEDNTGRVQTVSREENELLYELIGEFRRISGVPVLLNTSFNENEPIVHTPEQAINTFERTKMDCLGIGPFWLIKSEQAQLENASV